MAVDIENAECVIDAYLKLFGNRWNLLIMYQLFDGPKRFNELKRNLSPISQTVLVRHLKVLEEMGVIHREMIPGPPIQVYYSITEKGYSVVPSMISTYGWVTDNIIRKN